MGEWEVESRKWGVESKVVGGRQKAGGRGQGIRP